MTIEGKAAQRTPRIRLGMVGGGIDAFIGGVHRIAARLDDKFELVAGALSSTPARARKSGAALGLDPSRTYADFKEMAARESRLNDGIEAVAIVTPNHMHYPVAREFLKRGIHVICDKPVTATLADAKKLAKLVTSGDALFVLTHNYTGYPLVSHARELVRAGELGEIRGRASRVSRKTGSRTPLERTGQKQAAWRTDPKRCGAGGATGDIGTHAENLAEFVTGLHARVARGGRHTFVKGRKLDDDAHVLLRYKGGAKGMLWCSQVAVGKENGLVLRIYGTKGGIEWTQENPNHLDCFKLGEPHRRVTRAGAGRARPPPRDANAVGPPRGLSRRVREHLFGSGGCDQRKEDR